MSNPRLSRRKRHQNEAGVTLVQAAIMILMGLAAVPGVQIAGFAIHSMMCEDAGNAVKFGKDYQRSELRHKAASDYTCEPALADDPDCQGWECLLIP
ncbi:MAG: hypothetical protein KDD70_02100 [Bdellovibrionales bacterium]|nr:hypothetical protein [Bdellovibrionales bacterium]